MPAFQKVISQLVRRYAAEEEEGYIPKVIANPPVDATPGVEGGAWVLPFWRESSLLPKSSSQQDGGGGGGGGAAAAAAKMCTPGAGVVHVQSN